ncbi:hypothetical protein [Streptomyces viridosporus]|uniref:hypothetical protein n=1 Tax=Streptomyces viridosporus TaxID=67581 RepID=UPI001C3FCA8E|nr:hypothetical protein [Streptomyces viridosporus]
MSVRAPKREHVQTRTNRTPPSSRRPNDEAEEGADLNLGAGPGTPLRGLLFPLWLRLGPTAPPPGETGRDRARPDEKREE